MKKIILTSLILLCTAQADFDFFKNLNWNKHKEPEEVNGNKITNLLRQEIQDKNLEKTDFKVINASKYNSIINKTQGVEITIESGSNDVSSITYKLSSNIWYFVKTTPNGLFKFFPYEANDETMFDKNNFYLKVTETQIQTLFKADRNFQPFVIDADEALDFIVMTNKIEQTNFRLFRKSEVIKNETK